VPVTLSPVETEPRRTRPGRSNAAKRRQARAACKQQALSRTPAGQRRAERYRRRASLARTGSNLAKRSPEGWKAVPWARTAGCGRIVTGECVQLRAKMSTDGMWNVFPTGVQTCGRVWVCPVCAAKIRTRRSAEIRTAAPRWVASGGRLVMMTLTVRHGPEHPLGLLMDVEADAYRSLQRDARWADLKGHWRTRDKVRTFHAGPLAGQIRSWEITHGKADVGGSWHPHFHVLLFIRPGAFGHIPAVGEDGNRAAWALELGWIGDGWANRIEARLGARPDSHGFHVQELDASAADYVSKVADETARSDLKSGSRSIWHIIDAMEAGETWAVRAWREYVEATKNRRAIQWSRGLRDVFGLGVEQTDEALAAEEVEGSQVVETFDPRRWYRLMRCAYGEIPPALVLIEAWERRLQTSTEVADPPPIAQSAAAPPA
jgi:hypothetical protein